jgi:hypothetical protein
MSFIVMGLSLRLSGSHGENGLGPIKRLDLRFLIYTENNGPFWWIHIETYDIPDLLDE